MSEVTVTDGLVVASALIRMAAIGVARAVRCYENDDDAAACIDTCDCDCRETARAALEAALPLVRERERKQAFDGLMDAYQCWADLDGRNVIGNVIYILYPEFRDEARQRAAAIRSDKGGE